MSALRAPFVDRFAAPGGSVHETAVGTRFRRSIRAGRRSIDERARGRRVPLWGRRDAPRRWPANRGLFTAKGSPGGLRGARWAAEFLKRYRDETLVPVPACDVSRGA